MNHGPRFKIMARFHAAAILLSICLYGVVSAQMGNVTIMPVAHLDTCGTVDTLWITGDANIAGVKAAEFKIGYSHTYVSITSVIKGSGISSGDFLNYIIDSPRDSLLINIAILGPGSVFNGPATFAGIILSTTAEISSTNIAFLRSDLRDINNASISHNSSGATIQIDCTDPDVPGLTSPPNGSFTNSNRPDFAWNAAAGAYAYTLQYSQASDFSTGTITILGLSGLSYTPSALSDGIWYWHVLAADQAGNKSVYSVTWSLTVDTQSPAIPNLVFPSNGSYSNDNKPSFVWSAAFGAFTYTLQYSAASDFSSNVQTATGLSGLTYTPPTSLTDGIWYWHVKSTDRAGNQSLYSVTWSVTIDTQVPNIPVLVSPADGVYINDDRPTFTWEASSGALKYTLQYSLASDFTGAVTVTDISGLSYTSPAILADGVWHWHVKAVDQANNASAYSGPWAFTIDTQPPAVPTLSSPPEGNFTNDNTPAFTWNAAVGAYNYVLEYSISSNFSGSTVISGITGLSYTPLSLADGIWYWHVLAMDHAGNTSAYSIAWSFTLDTQPPAIPTLASPSNGSISNNNQPSFTWNAAAGAFTYTLQYSATIDFSSNVQTIIGISGLAYTLQTSLTDGIWYWHLKSADQSGNEGNYSNPWSLTIDTQSPPSPTGFVAQPGDNKIHLTWTNAVSDFNHIVIMRSDWYSGGHGYPVYDDAHAEGPYPSDTSSPFDLIYSGAGNSHDDVYDISGTTRDVYHYTAFTVDDAGNISVPVSSSRGRSTSYWLGDKTKDGHVYYQDLTYLSNTYWLEQGQNGFDAEFDIGPTDDHTSKGIPLTDRLIGFEDLVVFALNYGVVGPSAKIVTVLPNQDVTGPLAFSLVSSDNSSSAGDDYRIHLNLINNPGTIKALHCVFTYDHSVLEFISVEKSPELNEAADVFCDGRDRKEGADFSMALLGSERTIGGSGAIATFLFRRIKQGNPTIDFTSIDLRDAENKMLPVIKFVGGRTPHIPQSYELSQNYPNPFNPSTVILYDLEQAGHVTIIIYNIQGQAVRTLLDADRPAGSYRISWDGRNNNGEPVANGIYLYRMIVGDFSANRKMLLLK